MRPQLLDLASTVTAHGKLLAEILGDHITLEISSTSGLPVVSADELLIRQVLVNLCLNARDAMKDGGVIRLRVEEVEVGAGQTDANDEAEPGGHVCLSVKDTGCGMDEVTMERLFEPFFTTKESGQRPGLGLAMVRGIVQQHRGWVEVESCVGQGSTFRVYLPAFVQPPVPPEAGRKELPVPAKGTILVVDDDPMVLNVTRAILIRAGYVVLEACDGVKAVAIGAAHRAEIDLLYTDMVMPGELTGLQLAEKVLADKPGLKVIITSGYTPESLDLGQLTCSAVSYLAKPSPVATVLSLVQDCLQQR
jgi:CheY-like chemotaxis protein